MIGAINRYWRIIGTGVSFLTFGVGGLVLGVAVFPVLGLVVQEQERRQRVARAVIRSLFQIYIDLMRTLGVLRYDVVGLERLERQGLLIIANHPTLIDTVFLMAFVKNADCVVNSALWSNPFTRGTVRTAGWVRDDSGPEMLEACIRSLTAGGNLVIFPQGTRTSQASEIHLKRGAANIAVRGARNVTPVFIRCSPPTLMKGSKWWQVPKRRAEFTIEVGQDIEVGPFLARAGDETIIARQFNAHLEQYFSKEVGAHAVP